MGIADEMGCGPFRLSLGREVRFPAATRKKTGASILQPYPLARPEPSCRQLHWPTTRFGSFVCCETYKSSDSARLAGDSAIIASYEVSACTTRKPQPGA